jgi:hypothetical protein
VIIKLEYLKLILFSLAATAFADNSFAQSNDPAENRKYMAEAVKELADYLDIKCGDYKVTVKFDDTGFDYNSNPTSGTPTNADRVTAGLYAIASVCESGEAGSAKVKSGYNSIRIVPGAANMASVAKRVLTLTYDTASTVPIGRLREEYFQQLK